MDGEINFRPPNQDETCRTWYKIYGRLDHSSSKTPLAVLHGGPGACHDFLLPLADLATLYNIPVILYDQIGNGRSTHLRDKNGDNSFWTPALFRAELDDLIAKLGLSNRPIDVYGHSWGGMLAIEWAALQPRNLRRLILASSLASIDGWLQGVNRLKKDLPENIQSVLNRGEDKKDLDSPEYEAALEVFYKRQSFAHAPMASKGGHSSA